MKRALPYLEVLRVRLLQELELGLVPVADDAPELLEARRRYGLCPTCGERGAYDPVLLGADLFRCAPCAVAWPEPLAHRPHPERPGDPAENGWTPRAVGPARGLSLDPTMADVPALRAAAAEQLARRWTYQGGLMAAREEIAAACREAELAAERLRRYGHTRGTVGRWLALQEIASVHWTAYDQVVEEHARARARRSS